ncbi:hypothetical protein [Streptomyces sp. NBC_00872]|nr:hypothetical protein OG214_33550 [Streptomyces sp. NBC_00872]
MTSATLSTSVRDWVSRSVPRSYSYDSHVFLEPDAPVDSSSCWSCDVGE